MAKHTPGPWYLDKSDWPLIINPKTLRDNRVLATIQLPKGSKGTDEAGQEAVANAELMKDAPDLLELVNLAVIALDHPCIEGTIIEQMAKEIAGRGRAFTKKHLPRR